MLSRKQADKVIKALYARRQEANAILLGLQIDLDLAPEQGRRLERAMATISGSRPLSEFAPEKCEAREESE